LIQDETELRKQGVLYDEFPLFHLHPRGLLFQNNPDNFPFQLLMNDSALRQMDWAVRQKRLYYRDE